MTTTTERILPHHQRALTEVQHRAITVARDGINVEERTVELSFASDAPYERWFGVEILDMAPASVDLSRLNARHPLLLNHDTNEQIGVIERAWVDADRKARAVVRFSRSALGQEIFQDVQDGIRELVSVGYRINDMVLESREGDVATYRVMSWMPYEISLVSVPADPTVGVGRSVDFVALAAQQQAQQQAQQTAQVLNPPAGASAISNVQAKEHSMDTTTQAPAAAAQPSAQEIIRLERERVETLRKIGSEVGIADEATRAIADGTSVDTFRALALSKLVESGKITPAERSAEIGLTSTERRNYSVVRLMHAIQNPHDADAQKAAAFEIEASVAARKLRPVDDVAGPGLFSAERASSFGVPHDVLAHPMELDSASARAAVELIARLSKRDLTVGSATAGGNLVATDLLAQSFIELLRNRMVLAQLGATMLPGLTGNVAIPSQSGGASTYWVTEGNTVTESQATFGQVTMTPKTVGMFTDYSRRTLLQATPAIEMLVRNDLANGIAVEIDRAGLAGSGSGGQPTGVINTAGIGAVAGGTNGAAPTYLNMIALEEAVAVANADVGALAFCTNAKMRAQLRGTQQFASTNGVPVFQDDKIMGYQAVITNSMPANLTKGTSSGVCSAIAFGNWADLLMGLWGGLDFIVDPSTLATSGGRRLVALQDIDVAVRRAASFAAMLDALRT